MKIKQNLYINWNYIDTTTQPCLKVQQSLPGQRVNGEGLWLNSLDYLPVCYTQPSILTVWHVVCYQSVTRNSNNISGYVYNRGHNPAYTNKPLPWQI